MPSTIRRGDTGSHVSLCQKALTDHGYPCDIDGIFGKNTEAQVKAYQSANGLDPDGIVGPLTWSSLEEFPDDPTTWDDQERYWDEFVPLLGPAMHATYSFSGAQIPKLPPGVTFLSSKYRGEDYTNCSMFTAYFLGNGFGGPFTKDQWLEWQVAKGADDSAYRGFGPSVVRDWGQGQMMTEGSPPVGGVYLLQTFTTWPRGHSWIVLDYDETTGKILTLESNTSGSGLNGVGFGGLGPIRSTNAHDWKSRVRMTWESRTRGYSQIHMARLNINHQSVLDWIAGQ